MSQNTGIPVRDEQPQHDNRDKTAQDMDQTAPTGGQQAAEKQGEEPSGYRGENPSTAGPGNTRVTSDTPENADGRLNPSAPADTGTTVAKTPQ